MASSAIRAKQADEHGGAVRRAMTILRHLAQTSPLGCRLSDIASGTGLPPSTVHRLLRDMMSEGMVLRESGTGRLYKLGPFAMGLGPEASQHHFSWFSAICRPSLTRLAQTTGHSTQLSIRVGRSGLSLDLVEGKAPAHEALAKPGAAGFIGFGSTSVALLAAVPESLAEEILWENEWQLERAGVPFDTLRELVIAARRDGYSYSERIFIADLCAISLCIPNSVGAPFAALTVLARTDRIPPAEIKRILAHMSRESFAIARQVDLSNHNF